MKHFCLFLTLFVTSALNIFAQTPIVKKNRIIFTSGKIIQYMANSGNLRTPDESLKSGDPVYVEEKPVLVKEWQRVLLIRSKYYFEGSLNEIAIFDYSGKNLSQPRIFYGEVFILKTTGRILLAQQSSHDMVQTSILLDINGKLIKEFSQSNNIYDFEISDDDRVIWLLARGGRHGNPITEIKTVDTDGNLIQEFETNKAGMVKVKYMNKIYQITLDEPDFPG